MFGREVSSAQGINHRAVRVAEALAGQGLVDIFVEPMQPLLNPGADRIAGRLNRDRSQGTFMNLSKLVEVHQQEGEWQITPYRNFGRKGGFEPCTERQVTLACSSERLGEVVLDALQLAT
jgi:hypothetical protein